MELQPVLQAALGLGTALCHSLSSLGDGGEVRGEAGQLLRGVRPAQGAQGVSRHVHVCPLLLHHALQVLGMESSEK